MICNGPGGKEEGGGAKECGHGVGNPPMSVTFNGLRKNLIAMNCVIVTACTSKERHMSP